MKTWGQQGSLKLRGWEVPPPCRGQMREEGYRLIQTAATKCFLLTEFDNKQTVYVDSAELFDWTLLIWPRKGKLTILLAVYTCALRRRTGGELKTSWREGGGGRRGLWRSLHDVCVAFERLNQSDWVLTSWPKSAQPSAPQRTASRRSQENNVAGASRRTPCDSIDAFEEHTGNQSKAGKSTSCFPWYVIDFALVWETLPIQRLRVMGAWGCIITVWCVRKWGHVLFVTRCNEHQSHLQIWGVWTRGKVH